MEIKELKHANDNCNFTYGELQLAALGVAYGIYENKQFDKRQIQGFLDLITITLGAISSTPCMAEAVIMMGKEAKAIMDAKNGKEDE